MKLKKIVFVVALIALVSIAFADSNSVINEPGMIDVRSLGMGGTHIVDTADFYTLLKNPAGIGLAGKKNMISVVSANVGIPNKLVSMEKLQGIMDDYQAGKTIDQILPSVISGGTDISLNVGLDGPFCFGNISESGFAWGFFESVKADAMVPSLTMAKLNAQLEAGLVLGYGLKFELFPGTAIAIGATGEAFVLVPRLAVQDSLTNILSMIQGEESSGEIQASQFDNIPIQSVVGLSCDLGVQVRLFDFIDAAIVWEDVYSPYMVADTTIGEVLEDYSVLYSGFGEIQNQDANFRVGAGLNLLPNGAMGGLISSLKVQADVKDAMLFVKHFINKEVTALERSPLLNVTAGVEVGLMRFIYGRVGYSDGFATVGASIKLGSINIDAAVYTNELGRNPGSNSQTNAAVSLGLFL